MAEVTMTLESLGASSLKIHLRVGDQLGLAIMRGEYPPGSLLPTEARLCEMLGVSRTAMREAIRGLIAKGLVESRPKLGTRVRDPEYWNHLDQDVLRWQLAGSDTELLPAQDVRVAPCHRTGRLGPGGGKRRYTGPQAARGGVSGHGRCGQ